MPRQKGSVKFIEMTGPTRTELKGEPGALCEVIFLPDGVGKRFCTHRGLVLND